MVFGLIFTHCNILEVVTNEIKTLSLHLVPSTFFGILFPAFDRLCGLVVRVLGYRSGGPGSIPGTTRKKK
jgi:hypothetical protein